MQQSIHGWTRADLERLPDDGQKYEVIHGELLVSPVPRPAHEELVVALGQRLAAYCDREHLGRVYWGNPAFVTADSEVIPDIVVRRSLVPPPERWDDAPMPLLVVEVLSESTRRADLVRKRAFYVESGVPEYWIVDGDARVVRVVTSAGEHVETGRLTWEPGGAASALVIDVAALFGEVLGP
jgi:Uma2 family endonuclease